MTRKFKPFHLALMLRLNKQLTPAQFKKVSHRCLNPKPRKKAETVNTRTLGAPCCEGWHHELETPDQEVVYKGVVFNEMKGVFSDPESLIDRYLSHSLFPDTIYGYESGGDPAHIPDLTYEEFRGFH